MTSPIRRMLTALAMVWAFPADTLAEQNRSEGPQAVLAAFDEAVFANRNFDALPDLMREDYIQHNPLVPGGRDGFQAFFRTVVCRKS